MLLSAAGGVEPLAKLYNLDTRGAPPQRDRAELLGKERTMVNYIGRLGHRLVDWLYEHTLGITSPSAASKISPEERQRIKMTLAQGYAGRSLHFKDTPPKAGEKASGNGEAETGR